MHNRIKNIERHELIGLLIEVVKSKNPSLVGIKGRVVNETKNTIKVKQSDKMKTLLKNQIKIKIIEGGEEKQISGIKLVGRPEERLKK